MEAPVFENTLDFDDMKSAILEDRLLTIALNKHIRKLTDALNASNQRIAELEARPKSFNPGVELDTNGAADTSAIPLEASQ